MTYGVLWYPSIQRKDTKQKSRTQQRNFIIFFIAGITEYLDIHLVPATTDSVRCPDNEIIDNMP